ncbi:MAG TPA: AMP-binding protein [Marmoricola sp.]|nr:AMP-binding protein [Marmoricola sp.]
MDRDTPRRTEGTLMLNLAARAAQKVSHESRRQAVMVRTMANAGVIQLYGPVVLAKMGLALKSWGLGFAGGIAALGIRCPDQVGIVDELGSLTWGEVDTRSTRLAHSLRNLGVNEGDSVAVLCRNHRYFLEVSTAISRLGADILYLNTSFAAPQLGEVCEREKPTAIVYDEEFEDLIDRAAIDVQRVIAWTDSQNGVTERVNVETLISRGSTDALKAPSRLARPVILTSGTTGTPKGAPRSEAGLDAAVALLAGLDFKTGGTTHIAAPVFHTWGWAHLNLAMLLGSTVVLRRKFDPEECLRVVEEYRCDGLVVIPVMLQRMLQLAPEQRSGNYSSLRVVASSGSALPGDLATEWMDTFGDNLYNTYGSTEVAWATIAKPADMRAAPGTAGNPPPNTIIRIVDEAGKPLPTGASGRIFVGNSMLFEGYTGGGGKEVIDGLMSTGDVGRLDEKGRLFVEGRDDEMIVSGGENVFPKEVEDWLTRHDGVVEAAAIGVDDPEFGKRLRAFVVVEADVDLNADILKAWIKDNLARFKVPREIVFIPELPRNATGKVLKRELVTWPVD